MHTAISPPQQISFSNFVIDCVAFLKLQKGIPPWERLFFINTKMKENYMRILAILYLQICTALLACSKPIILELIFGYYLQCFRLMTWSPVSLTEGHFLSVLLSSQIMIIAFYRNDFQFFFRNTFRLGLVFAFINNQHQDGPRQHHNIHSYSYLESEILSRTR